MAGTLSPRRRNERPVTHVGATVGGRYRVESVLGAGAMGTVYDARHTVLDRAVALKVVSSSLLGDPALADLLLDEARAAARVAHPNLVQVFDAGVDEASGDLFLAMERVDAETLRAHLDRRGALPPREAVALVAPVLDALDAAHGAGTVHRDVKPDNVLVARAADGSLRPTLIDFGIARVLARDPHHTARDDEAVLGTPAYMSPEQRRAPSAVDAQADLWSAAVMLAEAVTGHAPRPHEPPDLADVPAPLRRVLERALDRDPARRYPDARALRDALNDAVAAPRTTRRAALVAVLVAALLPLGLVAARGTARPNRATAAAPLRTPFAAPPVVAAAPIPALALRTPAATASPVPPSIAPVTPRTARRPARRPAPSAPTPPAPAPARPWFEPRAGALHVP